MIFNSLSFFLFFGVVLAVHYSPLAWKWRKLALLLFSYVFYAAWDPPLVLLLWFSTLIDWFAARYMQRVAPHRRWVGLAMSLVSNLGLLGYFKYGGFVTENLVDLVALAGGRLELADPDIILPVGISFYTFQTLSYSIDVYRGNLRAASSFLDFALYVTFFPQLVAGPIVRASDFIPQCASPRRANSAQVGWGLWLLVLGLFQKVVIADYLMSPTADEVYSGKFVPTFADGWIGTFAYAIQVFCDFAGYSTCAIGVAMCLGFALPDNFRYPYAAIGFSDFWRRWHISLSQWLRDYVYVSAGGNRNGELRTYVNLMLTMLLGGLWHGASWNFVIWGGLHGGYLVAERALRALRWGRWVTSMAARGFWGAVTFLLVCLAWVFFRAATFEQALATAGSMIWPADIGLRQVSRGDALQILTVLLSVVGVQVVLRNTTLEQAAAKVPWWCFGIMMSVMIFTILLVGQRNEAFIYFQF